MCNLPKWKEKKMNRMDDIWSEPMPFVFEKGGFKIVPEVPVGWLCPRCERVNAPDIKQCPCQPPTLPNTVSAPKPGPQETK